MADELSNLDHSGGRPTNSPVWGSNPTWTEWLKLVGLLTPPMPGQRAYMKSIHSYKSSSPFTLICSVLEIPSSSPGLVDDPLRARLISNMVPAASTRETPSTSFRMIWYEILPPSVLWKSRASFRKISHFCFHGLMKFLPSLTEAQPSLMIATPPMPSILVFWRARGRETVDPVYVEVAVRVIGELMLI